MFHVNRGLNVASGGEALVLQNEIHTSAQFLCRNSKARVGKFSVAGHCYWAKWPGNQSWLNRLQKGPDQVAFEREIDAIRVMEEIGAPVPKVVLTTSNLIVFRDAGPTLQQILRFQLLDKNERILSCEKAALALASLHNSGVSHGRPLLRDICWDSESVTLLDFENFRMSRNNLKGHTYDLIWFVFSMYAQRNSELPEIDAAISAYRAEDTVGAWETATQWAHRNQWLDWVTRPIQLRSEPHAREYKAIRFALGRFTSS